MSTTIVENVDEIIATWQQAIYQECVKVATECGAAESSIDGAGADGDELAFTLAEIGQAFNLLRDKRDAALGECDNLRRQVETMAAEYHQLLRERDALLAKSQKAFALAVALQWELDAARQQVERRSAIVTAARAFIYAARPKEQADAILSLRDALRGIPDAAPDERRLQDSIDTCAELRTQLAQTERERDDIKRQWDAVIMTGFDEYWEQRAKHWKWNAVNAKSCAQSIWDDALTKRIERLISERDAARQSRARLVQLWQARGISARSWHAAERTWKP